MKQRRGQGDSLHAVYSQSDVFLALRRPAIGCLHARAKGVPVLALRNAALPAVIGTVFTYRRPGATVDGMKHGLLEVRCQHPLLSITVDSHLGSPDAPSYMVNPDIK